MCECVRHLVQTGRQRIALLVHDGASPIEKRRLAGFRQAHQELGLCVDDRQLFEGGKDWGYDVPGHQERVEADVDDMLSNIQPDAIIAADDYGAAQLIRALAKRKIRVPDDIAIVGHGNDLLSHYLNPPLTTIDLPVREVVEKAVAMLANLSGESAADVESVTLKPKLLIREST